MALTVTEDYVTEEVADELLQMATDNSSMFNESKGFRRRVGLNGRYSEFQQLKYWKFPREDKKRLAEIIPSGLWDIFNECWFLHFEDDDFLDLYNGKPGSVGKIKTISLRDNQGFHINYDFVTLNKGDLIEFDLKDYHEVKDVSNGPEDYLVFLTVI